jgi:hypothetical protein
VGGDDQFQFFTREYRSRGRAIIDPELLNLFGKETGQPRRKRSLPLNYPADSGSFISCVGLFALVRSSGCRHRGWPVDAPTR